MQFPFSFWGGFTPYFVPGLRAWYNAESLQALGTGYQSAVSSWPELVSGWTATQATGTNQPRFLPHGGGVANNYLRLPAISGNYPSTPDSAAVSITGTIDIDAEAALVSYASGAIQALTGKYGTATNQRSYSFGVSSTGFLILAVSADGGNVNVETITASASLASVGVVAGQKYFFRATWVTGTRLTTFFFSTDGTNWTQIGTTVNGTIVNTIFDGTAPLEIGSITSGTINLANGRVFSSRVYNGIRTAGGTLVAHFQASLGNGNSSSIVASTGETWTINRTGVDPAMIVSAPRVLWVTNDYMELPSASYGVAQNVGGITMFAVMGSSSLAAINSAIAISTNTADSARSSLDINSTGPAFRTGGRRLDADSFASTQAGLPVVNTSAIVCGVLDYSAATAQVFVNGSAAAAAAAFQTAGSTSNTASLRARIGSSLANTPASFMNGTLSQVLIYNRALTATEILNVSKYLALRTGGAIVI